MKMMKIIREFIAFTAILIGMTGWAGDSAPFLLDTTDPMVKTGGEVSFSYNSSWIGDDSSAEVVISADGTEIRRTTAEGEFVWSPTTAGKHMLMYTTYINGVAQDEVYTATVYADWKYTVEDGNATIVETTQKSGNVTIPPEIDGYPVIGIESDVYAGCHGLFITVPTGFTNVVSAVKSFEQNEWVRDDSESGEVYKSNDIDHNGSTYMTATVNGPCEFSFDWKVSSESDYDWLRWYLDGSQKAEISGEKSWQTVTCSLPEGEHTIKWEYSKDGSVDNGSDCGWVRMKENMAKVDFGDATVIYSDYPCSWGGDASWKNESDGSLRSGKITHGQSSWMEMKVSGAGRLTYRWKSSSEHCLDEVYDYGYLSVDGMAKGVLTDSYSLEGVAIGGETDWQTVDVDVEGEGEHILRLTFIKDGVDEGTVGEDCIWVSDMKFRPLTTLNFDIGEASGSAPSSVTELSETVLALPEYEGFNRPLYTLTGWSDGADVYAPGADFEMRATNVTLRAVYRANTISMPVVSSRDVVADGTHDKASAKIKITADEGATIYYTLDGSVPTPESMRYDGQFEVNALGYVTVKAIAVRDNYFDSPVATFSFTRKPYSAAECLNAGGWQVNLSGNAEWYRVLDEAAHDGDAALRSGAIGDSQSTAVEMKVVGEGSLSFWWKSSSEISRGRKRDYVSFQIDGTEYAWLGGETDWTNVVCNVTGAGEHTFKWEYIKNEEALQGEDCAWLDEVVWMGGTRFDITYENLKGATHQNPSAYYEGMIIKFTAPSAVDGYAFAGWTPSEITAFDTGNKVVTANWEWMPQDAVVDASITCAKSITVKADWVKTELEQRFGSGKKEAFIAKFGDDFAAALTKKTGKRDADGNELLVWHDYVAGTDPSDINSTFKAIIDMQDGKPVISWEPDLNSDGEERVYTVHGKENLSDIWHSPITSFDHFFKVDVAIPLEGTVTFNVGGGSSVNPISVRVGRPIGELPMPTRDEYTFLGWFTAAEGGIAVTPETVVTADMTIYARWQETHAKVQLWEGGPYWATTNVGAEKPEDYGYYFWWGDTVGYKRENNKWVASNGSNSNFSFGSGNTPTCNKSISTLQSEGWITSDGVLTPEHDAAHAHWGGDWRMPTYQELVDLCDMCDWIRTKMNGVYGYVVRGRGEYTSNSIFLPCVGNGNGTSFNDSSSYGSYWSSELGTDGNCAGGIDFGYGDTYHEPYYDDLYYGHSVRPVQGGSK